MHLLIKCVVIVDRGTDGNGDGLENEAFMCAETRFWATYDTLRTFVRGHLNIQIPRKVKNSKTRLTDYLAEMYDFNEEMDGQEGGDE